MGRHKALAIARVVPYGSSDGQPRYRCIAAYHIQYCQDAEALQAIRRFITLIQQNDNAELVRAEIESVQCKYGPRLKKPLIPDIPCPFTVSMLGIAFDADKREDAPHRASYVAGGSVSWNVLKADIGARDADKNDNISIVDVTDPHSPAYCLVDEYGDPPLDAHSPAVDALAHVDPVTEGMLKEAWPDMFELERASTEGASSTIAIPTLADLTLDSALDQTIASNDTHSIEMLLSDPTKARRVQAYLRRQRPFPSHAISLLTACLREDPDGRGSAMNLSGYNLSTEQVLQLLTTRPGVESVNLCFNELITAHSISTLLALVSSVRRLVLIGCTSIDETEMMDMLRTQPELFYGLNALIYPSLMPILDSEPFQNPVAFTIACTSEDISLMPRMSGCCLPVFTPTSVVQSLIDFADFCLRGAPYGFHAWGGMAAQASFTAIHRADQPFDQRSFVTVPYFPAASLIPGYPGAPPTSWMCIYQQGACEPPESPSYAMYAFLKCSHQLSATLTRLSFDTVLEYLDATSDLAQISSALQAYDVHGFIDGLRAEGRPSVSEELVTKLSQTWLSKEESQRRMSAVDMGRSRSPRESEERKYAIFMTQAQIDRFTLKMVRYARRQGHIAG